MGIQAAMHSPPSLGQGMGACGLAVANQMAAQQQEQLLSWPSVASNASSSEWNDVGLPPLPRQRSLTTMSAELQPVYQQAFALAANSVPMPADTFLMEQHSLQACMSVPLQGMGSGPLESLVYEAATRHCGGGSPRNSSSCCMPGDADAMADADGIAWADSLPPAALAAAAAVARARRSLHTSISMASTASGSSSACSQGQHSRGERSFSTHAPGSSPMAMDVCSSSSSRCLAGMDAQGPVIAQELLMLAKLKAIVNEREQLGSYEKQLRHKIEEEAGRAALTESSGSPRAAAAAAAAAAAQARHGQRSSSWSSGPRSCQNTRPAGHAAGGQGRHSNSTAAALLAAAADPAVVAEYMRAHRQQQQQHQACMAALAAGAAAGSSPRASGQHGSQHRAPARQQGLSPAAMAKLRQLMALQQQQIQVQQELLAML